MAARKRSRKSAPRRRTSKSVNITNTAQSLILANAMTEGMFGTNLAQFVTGVTDSGFRPGSDGSMTITAPELLGFTRSGWSLQSVGGNYSSQYSFTKAVKENLQNNGAKMVGTLIVVPIAFKVGSKLLARPRRDANKLLKMAGLSSMVKV